MERRAIYNRLSLFAVLLASSVGCGGSGDQLPRAQVTGTVTLNGEPVPAATILFRPASGRAGRGKVENGVIVEASTYGINDGIVLGTHKIAVQPIPEVVPITGSRMDEPSTPGKSTQTLPSYAADLRPARAKPAGIPAKYQDPDRSGLSAEITEDNSELTLELTK
ncbi:MAG TPA: hypothetical protein VF175_01920 [Lacipirellula sp.]